jgi:GTPase Era involved in 16S rRNA processing
MEILELSAKTGRGMSEFIRFLEARLAESPSLKKENAKVGSLNE